VTPTSAEAWWAAPRGRHWRAGRAPVVAGRGMVATSNPLAAAAGARMLAAGGTAVDAAIAADAVLGVTDPHLTGIGGDCAAVVQAAGAPAPLALNATGTAPSAATVETLRRLGHARMPADGPLTVTVPGAVAGWAALHERFGRLSLAHILAPAIDYALAGVPIAPVTNLMWQRQAAKVTRQPALAAHYLVDGRIPPPGTVRRAPALGATLQTIARAGADAFYRGELGARLAAGVQAAGGLLAAEDLAGYRPLWVEPLSTTFEGWAVWELPPNTHGLVVLVALEVLGAVAPAHLAWDTAEYAHAVIEAAKLGFELRETYLGDPAAMRVDPARLLAPDTTRALAARFDPKRAGITPGTPAPRGGTVYVAAADEAGTMVSFISSVFMHFGSGVVEPDTGVLLQNRGASFRLDAGHPQTLAPGRRPLHTIIPALAERPGEVRVCFGVTGADVQPQGQLQAFLGLARFGMTVQEALDAPRFRVDGDGTVAVEAGVSTATRAGLVERGHTVRVDDALGFGAAQMVARDLRSGVLAGATEPRRDGAVTGI
jgi:gamma-glutamyltranspeptidase/glutathione hydrolase